MNRLNHQYKNHQHQTMQIIRVHKQDAGVHELIEGQKQYARITVHAELNKKFSKWTEIDPLDATDDDIAATDEK